MIVNRIATAIREQDWSTITIELIVVVVGIFLGLQVNDWNEARKESVRERANLERILGDLDEMIAAHKLYEERSKLTLESLGVMFEALRTCELRPEDVPLFERALIRHQSLPRLTVARSGYDEMVASGALTRIDDAELKNQLSELYSAATEGQQIIEYFTADLGRASDIVWRHVAFDVEQNADGEYVQTVTYDLNTLCKVPIFRNAMVEVDDSTQDRLFVGSELVVQAAALRSLIEQRLSR